MTKDELQRLLDTSNSYSDALRKVGLSSTNPTLKKIVQEYGLSIEQMEINRKENSPLLNNLIGNKYGKLTVKSRAENDNAHNAQWYCDCDCGKKDIIVRGWCLNTGITVSCGCYQKEMVSKFNKKDISGNRYGKLIAIKPTDERSFGYIVWECLCDCGNIHYVTTNNLEMGHVESCGTCTNHNSKGEEKIKEILYNNKIVFQTEKMFDSCYIDIPSAKLRFDFYITNQNYLIEYDGKQHFIKDTGFGSDLENIQKRDEFKTQWCKKNNIPLIRIPYTHYDELCIDDLLLETSRFIIK